MTTEQSKSFSASPAGRSAPFTIHPTQHPSEERNHRGRAGSQRKEGGNFEPHSALSAFSAVYYLTQSRARLPQRKSQNEFNTVPYSTVLARSARTVLSRSYDKARPVHESPRPDPSQRAFGAPLRMTGGDGFAFGTPLRMTGEGVILRRRSRRRIWAGEPACL